MARDSDAEFESVAPARAELPRERDGLVAPTADDDVDPRPDRAHSTGSRALTQDAADASRADGPHPAKSAVRLAKPLSSLGQPQPDEPRHVALGGWRRWR
jgi:hypothetical protein